jgi:SAM-dependent methyltransferase
MSSTASTFAAQDAAGYDRIMGRWSRRLAPLLIRFGGLADGESVLDVGCGTGSLTFELPRHAKVAAVEAVDYAAPYVAHAQALNDDPRIAIRQGDACALPYPDNNFDRAFSQLVLQFIPDAPRAVAEMKRVVRPGGTVAACVWDMFGGSPHNRMVLDAAGVLDPEAAVPRHLFRPLNAPGEMEALWRRIGLIDVEQASLLIRMDFADFEDYWGPLLAGEGPVGAYVAGLDPAKRAVLADHVRRAYLANRPDGPRSVACVAWACRGTVPKGDTAV